MAIPRPLYRRPSSGRSSRQSSSRRKWGLWLATGCIAAITVVALSWTQMNRVPVDARNSCPLAGPVAVHAVLLDRSDPITPLQAQRLGQVVGQVVDEAEIGERIDLYVLTRDGTAAMRPLLSLCRPKSDGNPWYENQRRIHDRYVSRFRQPLDDELKKLTEPSTTETSPIMQSIKAVCVAAFGELPPGTPVHLTIASDMIETSSLLNHYKQRDFAAFSQTVGYKEVLADCHGAKVNILYLVRPRDARVQDRKHELFWEQFFDHMNATLIKLEAI
jgi:hypothetical protein